jgi:transposase-like protein
MKRSRFSEEQITFALRSHEAGTPVEDVCRQLGVSQATFYVSLAGERHGDTTSTERLNQDRKTWPQATRPDYGKRRCDLKYKA